MLRTAVLTLTLLGGAASAADPTYWQDVRPILRKHCTVCHSERKLSEPDVSAGLALDTPALVRKGGKVPVLVPGQPDRSLLVTLLTSKDKNRAMPLDADPLPPEQIAVVRKWVEAGAPDGTRPAADDTVAVAPSAPARVRKLDVAFPIKATFPKTVAGAVELALPIGPLPPVAAVAFSPDGKRLAAGVYGRVTVWDLPTGKPAKVLTNVLGAVNDLKFSPNGKLLAVAGGQPSARGDLRLFDAADWKLVGSLGGHLDTVSGVSFSPDGKKLASASFDKTVRLWDVADPKAAKVLHTFTGHSDFVYAVAFGPKGDWYATASKDRTGRVVDAATGKSRFTFSGMEQEVLAVAAHPNGELVLTSGMEPQLYAWNPTTGERVRRGTGVGGTAHEIALDAKGTFVAMAGTSPTMTTVEPLKGTALKSLPAGGAVFAVAVSADGSRLAAGLADGTVKLFDVPAARQTATLWSGAGGGDAGNWLVVAAEGYVAGSDELLAKAGWRAGGKPLADPKAVAPLLASDAAAKAVKGDKVPEPAFPK